MTEIVEDTSDPTSNPDQQFVAAEQAIEEAAAYANASQAAGDAGEDAKPVQRTELSPEQRRELARKTAKRQRKIGDEELARVYPGTIVIQRSIVVSDPHLASSASRFLGLVDRTLYLVNRYGLRYHTQAEINTIRDTIRAAVDAYSSEAQAAVEQGQQLAQQAKAKIAEWLEPSYTSPTLEVNFGVKARDTISLIRALETWDKAILEFAGLEFNDTASIGQIDTLRQRERRLFMILSRLCLRTIGGFSKRRDSLAQTKGSELRPEAVNAAEAQAT